MTQDMRQKYIRWFEDLDKDDLVIAGGKGANLGELTRSDLPVPPGFVLTTAAYDAFVEANDVRNEIVELASQPDAADPASFEAVAEEIHSLFKRGKIPDEVADAITEAYSQLVGDDETAVVARSSATAEDLPGASFAGQQETFLNLRNVEELLPAVKQCWASLWTARAMSYRVREGIAPSDVSLAVVVQELVPADAAGIMFTADPSTGQRDRAIINAAWGLGEAVVGGQVTPDTLTVEKESGRVIDRETTEKDVMTVRTESGTETQPVPAAKRRDPVLSDEQAAELTEYGVRIEEHYGTPQDIEWTLTDGEFAIVQTRPITALPDPVGEVPTDWSVPDSGRTYMRASIVEQLPDPLSPLFADLSSGPVVQTLLELFNEQLGEGLSEENVGFSTVNGYAYLEMRLTGFVRPMLGQPVKFTKAMVDILGKGLGVELLDEQFRPRYAETVERWEAEAIEELSASDLLAGAEELLTDGVRYYTGVQTVIPPAAASEITFTTVYDQLIRRDGDPPAQTYLLGFESVPIRAEKSLYDLAMWCRNHPELVEALLAVDPAEASALLDTETPPGDASEEAWTEWRDRFERHLDEYGHMLYSLDFVNPVPADDPDPVFRTLMQYLQGRGRNPHERQQEATTRRERLTEETLARLSWPLRGLFRRSLLWAQTYVPEREDALTDIGLGWPRLRELLLELGERFVAAGALENAEDVFWLNREEVEQAIAAVERDEIIDSFDEKVRDRRARWRGQKRATPPQILPEDSWMTSMEAMMPAEVGTETGNTLEGVAASAGRVTATARVIDGPEDFSEIEPGDILVARITTPAWTPLFALASGVVTDIGGPLSHGSIVAREYGIPAVLGTGNATHRIEDGQTITVDGDAGTVTLSMAEHTEEDVTGDAPTHDEATTSSTRTRRIAIALGVGLALVAWWRRRRNASTDGEL